MADIKAVLLLAANTELPADSPEIERWRQKGAWLPNYAQGRVLDNSVEEAELTRLNLDELPRGLAEGRELIVVDLGENFEASGFGPLLTNLNEAIDRKTIVAVVTKNGALFYGHGVKPGAGRLERAIKAEDVLPTLAAVGEFFLKDSCTGAVIYQALKNPNYKLSEIGKLKAALKRLENALGRGNREPWDKHDCA